MSQLIQIRQRIQAIETIKKITHAMRLIAMSTHSRLKNQHDPLTVYVHAITNLFAHVLQKVPKWINPIIQPSSQSAPTLIILIGSQKGLCGTFNLMLFQHYHQYVHKKKAHSYVTIAIGKKAIEFIKHEYPQTLLASYDEFSHHAINRIAKQLVHTITTASVSYSCVTLISSVPKTFLIQKPISTMLIPFDYTHITSAKNTTYDNYLWEYTPDEILDFLAMQYIEAQIHYYLFQSLLAEHAARFISMDNSNRNATNLLEEKNIEYNKIRQAKITKELTEIAGSF